ncbi:DUF4174 domain-containing protein [Brevirhabdus sp.]|uniref:DUF4174 domain-containing protein n=1 Tax=Brevirhabdus sp. TaxID=2004514 RepID=UPI004059182C
MKTLLTIVLAALIAAGAQAQTFVVEPAAPSLIDHWKEDPTVVFDAIDVDLNDLKWLARPVVVFADTPADPNFIRQVDLLAARPGQLAERDVIVITDTDPEARSALRQKLRPRGFALVLIGKDGGIKLRKPFPWDVREISRAIDKTPLREQELRERRNINQ